MSFRRDMEITLDALAQMQGLTRGVATTVLNETAREGRDEAVRRIGLLVNLKPDYVRAHLRWSGVTQVGKDSLEAKIQATGRGTLLTRFPYRVLREKNHSKAGSHPAGISGSIVPGRQYTQRNFWVIPNLKKSHTSGLAYRTGSARNDFIVLHGPSVNQVFQSARGDLSADLQQRLTAKALARINELHLEHGNTELIR